LCCFGRFARSLSAQRYGSSIEIAIADRGIGILGSLGQLFKDLKSDAQALDLALKPGVSRVRIADAGDDEWSNSGFGLYVLSQLGRRTGSFMLLSGKGYVRLPHDGTFPFWSQFTGTFLGLQVQRPKGQNLGQFIEQIIAEGEEKAASSDFPRRASKSTKSVF
jgi:hypothetical protein